MEKSSTENSLSRLALCILFHKGKFEPQKLSFSVEEVDKDTHFQVDMDCSPYFLLLFAIQEIVAISPPTLGDEIDAMIQLLTKAASDYAIVYRKVKRGAEEGMLEGMLT